MEEIPVKNDAPLYNSRIVNNYYELIKKKYSYINTTELLQYAKMTPYEVVDPGHWFTQEQIELFHERLSQIACNESIAREAGRHSASPGALGVLKHYLLGFLGPVKVYELIGKMAEKFTRSATFESKKLASNRFEIIVTPNEGVLERPFMCENRKGFFESITLAFTNKLPILEHPECVFAGGEKCRYIISWETTTLALWEKIRNLGIGITLICNLILIVLKQWDTVTITIPISIIMGLSLALISERKANAESKSSLSNFQDSLDNYIEQIDINYNNAVVTNEIGQVLSGKTNIDDILKGVVQVFQKRLNYDRGLVLLANEEKTQLEFRTAFGYGKDQVELYTYLFDEKKTFNLDKAESKGPLVVSFREQKPFLINSIDAIEDDLSQQSLIFMKKLGTQSFICCPIVCDEESRGILAVDNLTTKRPLIQSDVSLIMGIASVIGISIRNVELLEASERQFTSILQVLAASIDARDPLTAGHSEKVTEYSIGICNEMGLSREYCEMVRVAALLHDYGKIGVPDSILKKTGTLTETEREIIETHAGRTREILEQVNFEGLFCQVPEIAGCHHEKMDGTGYPLGLIGEAIPLGSRIIAVADFFEAITSMRHYRDPMPIERAVGLIKELNGNSFDENVVEAFLSYLKDQQPIRKVA